MKDARMELKWSVAGSSGVCEKATTRSAEGADRIVSVVVVMLMRVAAQECN